MPSATDLPQLETVAADERMELVAASLYHEIIVLELPSVRQFAATRNLDDDIEVAHFGLSGRYEEDIELIRVQIMAQMLAMSRPPDWALTFRGFVADNGRLYTVAIEVDGEMMETAAALWLCQSWDIPFAPRLTKTGELLGQWLNRRPIQVAAVGKSHIPPYEDRLGIIFKAFGGPLVIQSNN